MYERLLKKNEPPTSGFIEDYLGEQSYALLTELEKQLSNNYQLSKELKFPFGNNYGWGYKYSHKTSHICYVFFELGAFTVMLQLGDNCVAKVQEALTNLLPKTYDLWQNRYPCGEQGGWVHYRVLNEDEIKDIMELIKIKKKPISSL